MNDPQRVAVVGATGYAGFELAQLLLRHPKIQKPTFYLRESSAHVKCLTEIFPHLRGWGEAPCKTYSADAVAGSGAGTVFLATPHEASLEMVPQLLNAGLRVVDLSGAFRFHDPETFAHWYKLPAPPKNLAEEAVYGLPELYADQLPDARLVANPGCYPTSVILGLRPLVESGWIAQERGIVADCKSGATGAGKEPKKELHFAEVDENFRAYGLVLAPAHAGSDRPHGHRGRRHRFHDAPLAGGARHPFHSLRVACRAAHGGGSRIAVSRVLCGPPDGAPLAGRKAAGAAACGAHEFLRYRICARSRGAGASRS